MRETSNLLALREVRVRVASKTGRLAVGAKVELYWKTGTFGVPSLSVVSGSVAPANRFLCAGRGFTAPYEPIIEHTRRSAHLSMYMSTMGQSVKLLYGLQESQPGLKATSTVPPFKRGSSPRIVISTAMIRPGNWDSGGSPIAFGRSSQPIMIPTTVTSVSTTTETTTHVGTVLRLRKRRRNPMHERDMWRIPSFGEREDCLRGMSGNLDAKAGNETYCSDSDLPTCDVSERGLVVGKWVVCTVVRGRMSSGQAVGGRVVGGRAAGGRVSVVFVVFSAMLAD